MSTDGKNRSSDSSNEGVEPPNPSESSAKDKSAWERLGNSWKAFTDFAEGINKIFAAVAAIIAVAAAFGIISATSSNQQQSRKENSAPSIHSSSSSNEPAPSTRPTSLSPSASPAGIASLSVPASQSLINMTPVSGSSPNFAAGPPQSVNGHDYQEALYDTTGDDRYCYPDDDYFNLDRKYHHFRATIGLADSTPSADAVTFVVLLDNQQEYSRTLSVGQTQSIDVDVSGVFRIALQGTCSSSSQSGNQVVAAWINPVAS